MGKFIYGEWLNILYDYLVVLKKNEGVYEILLPSIIALITGGIYVYMDITLPALLKMKDLLPTALSILIGFTITCITVLATSGATVVNVIKSEKTQGRVLRGKVISLYQWLLIMFSYALLMEIILLIFIFFIAFILRIYNAPFFMGVLLVLLVYFTLHILLLLIRAITGLYFSFLRDSKS